MTLTFDLYVVAGVSLVILTHTFYLIINYCKWILGMIFVSLLDYQCKSENDFIKLPVLVIVEIY